MSIDTGRLVTERHGLFATIERRAGITVSGLVVIGLAVVAWIAGNHFGGRSLYLASYIALVLVGIAVFLARRKRPLEAERSTLPRRARVGQTLDVRITLRARARTTTFRIEEQVHPHLAPTVTVPIPVISPGEDIEHGYVIQPRLRGVYTIGPLTAEFADPMGFSKRRQELLPEVEIIVHPHIEDVLDRPLTRAFEDPPVRPPKSRPWPQGFEFYGMRDYVPGDDLRRIVWRAFGRTDKLLVREFEQGISDRISVVLDTDVERHSRGEVSDTFETAIEVAASAGVRHIKDGMTVRLVTNQGFLGAFRGPRARLPYLDELAKVQRTEEPLHRALELLATSGRIDDHVIIVTGHLDSRAASLANLMVSSGASITMCALLWEEADPMTMRRAREVGAQVVKIKRGSSLGGSFRASLQTKAGAR